LPFTSDVEERSHKSRLN